MQSLSLPIDYMNCVFCCSILKLIRDATRDYTINT